MLAELVDHVIGIDPDRDWITAAVVDAKTTGVVATAKFAANNDGYDEAVEWADTHTEPPVIAAGSLKDPAATDAA